MVKAVEGGRKHREGRSRVLEEAPLSRWRLLAKTIRDWAFSRLKKAPSRTGNTTPAASGLSQVPMGSTLQRWPAALGWR